NEQFDLPAEKILSTETLPAGSNTLTFLVPSDTNPGPWGQSIVRFRLSSTGGLPPTGPAQDGEVEDYFVQFGVRPVAAFQMTPSPLEYGSDLTLEASGSYDPPPKASSISLYEWDLDNDGQFDDLVSHNTVDLVPWETLKNLGLQIGVNPIQLRVTDFDGLTAVTSQNLEIFIDPDVVVPLPSSGSVQELSRSGSNLLVRDVNQNTITFQAPFSAVSSLTVTGDQGNDTLIVDFAGGNPIPAEGLRLNGQGFEDFDTLELHLRTEDLASLVTTFTGPQSGIMEFDGSTIEYTGLEPVLIDSDGSVANASFTLPAGAAPYGPGTTIPGGYGYSSSGTAAGFPGGVIRWYSPSDTNAFAAGYWGLTDYFYAGFTGCCSPWNYDTGVGLSGPNYMSRFSAATYYAAGSDLPNGRAVWHLPSVNLDTDGNNVPNTTVPVFMTLTVRNFSGNPVPLMSSPAGLQNSLGIVYQINPANGTGGAFSATVRMEVGGYNGAGTPVVTYYNNNSTGAYGAVTSFASAFWTDKEYVYLEDNGDSTDGLIQLRSGNGTFETTTFPNPSGSLTITAQGNTLVRMSALDDGFAPTNLILNGQTTDTYRTTAANVVPDGTDLAVNTATYDLNGFSDTIHALTGNGTVDNSAAGATTLTVASGSFSGVLTDSGTSTLALTKTTGGTLTLNNASTYSGQTTVNQGTLLVNNSLLSPAGTISFAPYRTGALAANPVTDRVYAAKEDWPGIAVIDAKTNSEITTVPTSGYHTGIAVDPIANRVYVSQQFASSVRVIDGTSNAVITDISVGGSPINDLAVNPNTNRLYVIRANTNQIVVFNTLTNALVTTIPIASRADFITVDPGTNRVYASRTSAHQVTVIDGATNTVLTDLPVGSYPNKIGIHAGTHRVYVPNGGSNTLSVIDGVVGSPTENTVIATVPVGGWPIGVAVDEALNWVYVVHNAASTVWAIDGNTNAVIGTAATGAQPGWLAVLPSTGRVFVSCGDKAVHVHSGGSGTGSGAVVGNNGATLGGTGTIAGAVQLNNTSHLAPGTSIESLAVGSVTWSSGTFFDVEIDGTAGAGVTGGHDLLSVSGGVTLGNATLAVDLGFGPSVGNSFKILDKTSAGAITGTFYDLPEGKVFSAGGSTFQITYQGGDGNDVVLTTLSTTSPTLTGTPGGDYFVVKKNGSNVEVYQGTTPNPMTLVYSAALSGLTTLTIDGLGGNDSMSVDFTAGNALPSGGLTFHGAGQTGTPGDVLHIVGGTQGNVVYNYTNAHDGSIVLQNYGTINYTGLEPISNSGSATDLVFNLPGGGDQARLKNLGGGTLRLESTAGVPTFEQTDFATPSGSITINSDGNAGLLNVLGTFDFPTGLGDMDVNPNGDLVYIASGMGGSGLVRVNASSPASMTSTTLSYGGGVAVDPVTGRYATTSGYGGWLYVYNANDTLYDSEDITGCGGALAAGNGTFGISTQCTDTFHIYNESTMSLWTGPYHPVGSWVTYNGATDKYYWRTDPSTTYVFDESGPAAAGSIAGYFVAEANPVTNRLYALNTSTWTLNVLNGTTHAVTATIPGAAGDVAVDTALDRIYFIQGGAIQVYNGAGTTSLGTISLPVGYTPYQLDMAVADDRLYVLGSPGSGPTNRLFVMQTGAGVAPGSDTLTVDQSGGDAIPAGGLIYNGGDGDDKLSIDLNNNANYLSANSITFNGGGQTSGDSIEVLNAPNVSGRGTDYIADTSGTANSGRIIVNPGGSGGAGDKEMKIYFTGLAPATLSGSGPLDVIVNVDATTTVDVKDDSNPGDGWNIVDGNSTFEDVTFSGYSTLNVYSGNGAETITLQALDSAGAVTTINLSGDNFTGSDSGNDTFDIQASPAGVTVNLVGGAGDDTFQMKVNVSGTINGGSGSETSGDKLDVSGHATAQVVDLGNSSVTGLFAGAANGFANIEDFVGDGNNDTLRGTGSADTFTVSSQNDGTVSGGVAADFTDFSKLEGVGGNDTFTFNASLTGSASGGAGDETFSLNVNVPGTIDGGSGGETNGDKLNASGHGTAQVVDLGNSSVTALFGGAANGFANIEDFAGDGSNDTLRGTGSADTFTVSSQNDGTVSGGAAADFTDFSKLEGVGGNDTFTFNAGLTGSASGGAGDDTFNLNVNVPGTIDGGAGGETNGDKLDLSGHGTAQVVNLGNSSVTGLFAGAANGFANIESLKGDGSNDTLLGANSVQTWNITGANDGNIGGTTSFTDFSNLTGGTANDTFAFGASGSLSGNLNGGAGSNTLDYSSYGTGVTVDLDKTTAPGAPLISGTIASIQNFLGTTLADTLSVDALSGGVARTVNGNSGASPNVLNVDAKGQTATDNGSQITFGGGHGTIT
ncbi:MAG TPA: GEVED domain-containing protein, partial [Candidatus Anammoximicrobium sp.]|nr:GEVED domain-containing protein [Candidatus Anammoximicrobium sp.]